MPVEDKPNKNLPMYVPDGVRENPQGPPEPWPFKCDCGNTEFHYTRQSIRCTGCGQSWTKKGKVCYKN